jgi:hypothetical protein
MARTIPRLEFLFSSPYRVSPLNQFDTEASLCLNFIGFNDPGYKKLNNSNRMMATKG